MAQVDKAVANLQDMWYLAVVEGLGLDKSTFMFMQTGEQLPYTTSALWQLIDTIPPKALTAVLSLGSVNSFYQDYGGLLGSIISPVSDDLVRAMGDSYDDWNNYKKNVSDADLDKYGWSGVFQRWAERNMPTGQVPAAIAAFNKDNEHNIVNISSMKYLQQSDRNNPFNDKNHKLYNIQISDITGGRIAHGPKGQVHMNNKASSSDVSTTWAKGGVSGVFDIFSLGGSSSYSSTTSKFTNSEVTIDATFENVAPVPTFNPGAWYNIAFLTYAYNGDSAWSASSQITWDSTFGPNGNMQRVIGSLVVVDGIEVTMTSNASYSSEEQTAIKAQAKGGVWPFFSASASGGFNSDVTFDEQGRMTVKTTTKKGNPMILGANVLSIPKALGISEQKVAATVE
ncbi:hypothetical protein [Aeromonas veronii]|uniref:hypothetical protein n=1 Tax=Aeromonas veronii TaxID=654 RepID=UPI0013025DD3|nr:hypothetical protein [Aeromonas veronii]KAE9635969.1 hypothetical protein GO977_08805 [Aeromonas veronii]